MSKSGLEEAKHEETVDETARESESGDVGPRLDAHKLPPDLRTGTVNSPFSRIGDVNDSMTSVVSGDLFVTIEWTVGSKKWREGIATRLGRGQVTPASTSWGVPIRAAEEEARVPFRTARAARSWCEQVSNYRKRGCTIDAPTVVRKFFARVIEFRRGMTWSPGSRSRERPPGLLMRPPVPVNEAGIVPEQVVPAHDVDGVGSRLRVTHDVSPRPHHPKYRHRTRKFRPRAHQMWPILCSTQQ